MPKLSRPLHRVHIMLYKDDWAYLLATVGEKRAGMVVREHLHKYLALKRDQEAREIDNANGTDPPPRNLDASASTAGQAPRGTSSPPSNQPHRG